MTAKSRAALAVLEVLASVPCRFSAEWSLKERLEVHDELLLIEKRLRRDAAGGDKRLIRQMEQPLGHQVGIKPKRIKGVR